MPKRTVGIHGPSRLDPNSGPTKRSNDPLLSRRSAQSVHAPLVNTIPTA